MSKKTKRGRGFWIFRAWIRNRFTGEKIWAKWYGKKAFRIWVAL